MRLMGENRLGGTRCRCRLSDQLLRAHVARRAGNRTTRIRRGPAVRDVRQSAELIELRLRVGGELAVVERLSADQHRVIEVAPGKEKQVLQVPRREQATPRAVFGIGDARENLRLDRSLYMGKRVSTLSQRHVLDEQ